VLQARPSESALYGYVIVSARATSPEAVEGAIRAFHEVAADLLVLRIPAVETESVHAAAAMGARLCDILVSYALPAARWAQTRNLVAPGVRDTLATDLAIELGRQADGDPLARLAAQAFAQGTSHWHADPRTSGPQAAELYARWTRDLVRKTDTERPLVVARQGNLPVGFVAVEPIGTATWRVPLAAVDPVVQGQGCLPQLLSAAVRCLPVRPDGSLVYETQLTNIPAVRAVESLGFRLVGSHLTFHLWRVVA
jgi:ribosomal protein S18 acetylase RimI-like enzyme